MVTKIRTRGTPPGSDAARPFSENIAGYYPLDVAKIRDEGTLIGHKIMVPLEPISGLNRVPAYLQDDAQRAIDSAVSGSPLASGDRLLGVASEPRLYDPSTLLSEPTRTMTSMQSARFDLGGPNLIFSVGPMQRYRLMGFQLIVPSNVTTLAGADVALIDDVDVLMYLGTLGTTNVASSMCVNLPGNGLLSGGPNRSIYVNLGADLTAGEICCTVWGCIE